MLPVGITALAIDFPDTVRRNEWWLEHHPGMVASAAEAQLARLFRPGSAPGHVSAFDAAMAPYLEDPFRGGKERRVLAPGETSVGLARKVVERLLASSGHRPEDFDLVMVSAMRPDTIAVGDAAWLMRDLGWSVPAINFETACSSSIFGLDLACSLVRSGRHRRILVVVTCTYSRDVEVTDTLSWFLGDGAAAFVVEASAEASEVLAVHLVSTAETCGAFVVDPVVKDGEAVLAMSSTKAAAKVLHDTAEPLVRTAVDGLLSRAGIPLHDVDFFAVNTPTAWYADFVTRALGVPSERTISTYQRYANIGPALMPVNLVHAVAAGHVRTGSLVLGYSVGSSSTAAATLIRWGSPVLAPIP
jgi:3-oxoacyl-[acyl-carrier-protein] synthase-3